jgi:hypothetical protein
VNEAERIIAMTRSAGSALNKSTTSVQRRSTQKQPGRTEVVSALLKSTGRQMSSSITSGSSGSRGAQKRKATASPRLSFREDSAPVVPRTAVIEGTNGGSSSGQKKRAHPVQTDSEPSQGSEREKEGARGQRSEHEGQQQQQASPEDCPRVATSKTPDLSIFRGAGVVSVLRSVRMLYCMNA